MMQKVCKKGFTSNTTKTVVEAVGPLTMKIIRHYIAKHWFTKTVDQTRPGVPKGTVADVLEMLSWESCIEDYVLTFMYWKLCVGNPVLEFLYWKYCIGNIVL